MTEYVSIAFEMPVEIEAQVNEYCDRRGLTLDEFLTAASHEFLEEHDPRVD
jgi:hypothetical protein